MRTVFVEVFNADRNADAQASIVFHGFHDYRSGAMTKRGAAMLNLLRRSMPAPPAWAWHPAYVEDALDLCR